MYNVEDIIAERWHHGQLQYLVCWQGYSEVEDTWEPLAHLSDALEYVARWNEEKKKHDAEAELVRQKKKSTAQQGSSSSNADAPQNPQLGPQRRQTSLVWKAFREATPEEGGKDLVICQVEKLDGTLCGQAICRSGGTSNLWSHLNASHKDWVVQQKANEVPTQHTFEATGDGVLEVQPTAIKLRKNKWHKTCRRLAWWIVQVKRPSALVNDQSFKQFCSDISSGKFQSCRRQTITKHIPQMCPIGVHEVRRRIALLVKATVKPSRAADTWSDSTKRLVASMLYFIDEDWTQFHEVLLNCTRFTGERHTGEAIRQQTVEDLDRVGLTFNDIHAKVSDQGSNIKEAWGGLPGGYCVCHMLELSVNVYSKSPGVCDAVQKPKGITPFLHRSGHRLINLECIQKRLELEEKRPPKTGNSFHWSYTHKGQEWFRKS